MPDDARGLICLITYGTDHELSSVALTIANGGITAGLKVSIFLSSSGVDLVRKRAADTTQVNPLEPLANLIKDFMARWDDLGVVARHRPHDQLPGNPNRRGSPAKRGCGDHVRMVRPRRRRRRYRRVASRFFGGPLAQFCGLGARV
jgi:hypothetical protein